MQKFWLASYPAGVPHDIDPGVYGSLVDLIDEAFRVHASRTAYVGFGVSMSFAELDARSLAFAAWLQSTGLRRGDRVALMMPNVLQYPVALAGVLRAGMVIVNVNPLYTARELEHQLKDSGARAIVILENFAHVLQQVVANTSVEKVVVTGMGDLLGGIKGMLVNAVVKHVKKMVPAWDLPEALSFREVVRHGQSLALAPVQLGHDDLAVLQYTGGTTGVSKGAALSHRNLIANLLQSEAWIQPAVNNPKRPLPAGEPITVVCALPLYHIFAFTICALLGMRIGAKNLLIPNPRDLDALVKEIRPHRVNIFPAVNTLYNALVNHEGFRQLDFSGLVVSNGGGMAVQAATAEKWLALTGCPICEGYGLSETSPSATCNPTDTDAYSGTIGLPLPSTEVVMLDDDGQPVAIGERGEIAIRGPQVMTGYWQRPDETARVFTSDGFFRTGDIGVTDERGFVRIVDRKKDMILVSGFNVYPNEVEQVAAMHPGVLEVAAVGVPDEKTGETVKLFVVRKDPALTEQALMEFCAEQLTGYKRPRQVEFRNELPKTNVGKILRRALREAA
ncbi:MAG: long-chain-fatty-acid--CoA ligase [Betaproteobacteria bacterium]|nr:long-chain-fatty-acid--CoA ligase [Betaproteobacteria bacterium]